LISLGRIAYPATSPFIIEALDDGEESVRQAAYISLGLMSTPETTAVLIDAFENSRDYNARCFAAVGLGLSGRVDAAHSLNEFLGELKKLRSWRKVDDLVISTLIAVRVNSNADFSDNLMSVAQRMDKCKASDELKVAAIDALAIAGGIQAIEVIIENVKSKSQLVAESCVVSLGRLGNRVAVNALTTAFENSHDPRMKGMIQISLGQIADNKAKKFLSDNQPRIADELYVHTSWLIACGLAKLDLAYTQVANTALYGSDFNKHDDAVASRSDEYELRGAAALSLGLYGAPAARVQLEKCLKETSVSDQLSSHIATALGMLGTDEAAQVLLNNAEQFNYSAEARRGFATALGMCSTEEANAQLANLLLNDTDPTVRWTSAHALAGARDQYSLEQLVDAIREDIHQAKPD
ncbi:MAG: HEAT repeat domain-containing protein, partial [Planctomycetota bacterium]|nr:HEAT repeat domain-containing protein [Planctomycetota bacterium]